MDRRPPDDQIPEGLDFLDVVAPATDLLSPDHVRSTLDGVGTLLSLLDRLGTCWWGCRGGNHVLHYLVIRGCSTTAAGIHLVTLRYYDEALSLARNVAETGNLLWLFAVDNSSITRWMEAERKDRLREFSPRAVREAIEKLDAPLPIDQSTYRKLSEVGTHVTPELRPQTHTDGQRPMTGGIRFDPKAAELAVEHLALALCAVASGGCRVVPAPAATFSRINDATVALIRHLASACST